MADERVKLGIVIGVVAAAFLLLACCGIGWLIIGWAEGIEQGQRQIRTASAAVLPGLRPQGAEFASEDALAADMTQRASGADTAGLLLFLAIERPDGSLRIVRDDGISDVQRKNFEQFLLRDGARLATAERRVVTPFHGQGSVWFGKVVIGGEPYRPLIGIETAD